MWVVIVLIPDHCLSISFAFHCLSALDIQDLSVYKIAILTTPCQSHKIFNLKLKHFAITHAAANTAATVGANAYAREMHQLFLYIHADKLTMVHIQKIKKGIMKTFVK